MFTKTIRMAPLLIFVLSVGCNSNYEGLVPVTGKVTFNGGPPPTGGFLSFIPVERMAGKPARPGRATFGADGMYQATSFQPGDGLFPGRYSAVVTCNKGALDYSKKDPFREASYVADGYKPAEVVVEPDSKPITLDLDVPRKKG